MTMNVRNIVIGLLIVLMMAGAADAIVIRNGSSGWINTSLDNTILVNSTDNIEIDQSISNLQLWVRFDENTGTTAYDQGNGNYTSTIDSTSWNSTNKKYGNSSATIRSVINSNKDFNATNNFTLMFWGNQNNTGTQNPFEEGIGSTIGWQFYATGGNRMYFKIFNSTGSASSGYMGHSINTWNHYAVTYDNSTNTISFFYNGVAGGSYTFVGTIRDTTQNVRFGYVWGGEIDDMRGYTRKLTQDEINSSRNNNHLSSGNITHWYDAGTGNVVSGYNISVITPANTNYTITQRQNDTSNNTVLGTALVATDGWINGTISGTKYQYTDIILTAYSNGTSTPEEVEFQFQSEASGGSDTTAPTYSGVSHNQTTVGLPTSFSVTYNDETALHPNGQVIFSTNNSGTWENSSIINFSTTPSTIVGSVANLNSTVGAIVGYRWYANDSAGNYNNTPIYTLTTTPVSDQVLDGDLNLLWVRDDGNNSCNGQNNMSYTTNSTDCAWLTPQQSGNITAGQMVIMVGAFTDKELIIYNSGNSTSWITYDGYNATMNNTGSKVATMFSHTSDTGAYVRVQGFTLNDYDTLIDVPVTGTYWDILYNKAYNSTGRYVGGWRGNSHDIVVRGNTLIGNVDILGSTAQRSIYSYIGDQSTVSLISSRISNITIEDNYVANGGHNLIELHTANENVMIRNNTVRNGAGNSNINLHNFANDNISVINNTLYSQPQVAGNQFCLEVTGSTNLTISGNTCYNFSSTAGKYGFDWRETNISNDLSGVYDWYQMNSETGNVVLSNNTFNHTGSNVFHEFTTSGIDALDGQYLFYNFIIQNETYNRATTDTDIKFEMPGDEWVNNFTFRDLWDTTDQKIKIDVSAAYHYITNSSVEYTDNRIFAVLTGTLLNETVYYPTKSNASIKHSTGSAQWIYYNNTITPSENHTTATNNSSAINLNNTGLISNTTITLGVGESKNINVANVSGTTYDLIYTGNSTNIESKTASGGIVNFSTILGEGSYSILEETTPESDYIPPSPTSLNQTNGSYWVNYTWQVGTGNITDSYNITLVNDSVTYYINGSNQNWTNSTISDWNWSNITVYAYNNSGIGTLSESGVGLNTQLTEIIYSRNLAAINRSVNKGESYCIADYFTWISPTNGTEYTYTCGHSNNWSVTVPSKGAVWVNYTGISMDKVRDWT